MNNVLISSARLVLPGHQQHGKIVDIRIEQGQIREIADKINANTDQLQVIDAQGAIVTAGFFDLNSNFGEPGLETKEDIATGTAAAAAAGFTEVAIHPNTNPPLHSRSEIALVVNTAKGNLVNVFPIGSLSKKREGKELAELYDMKTVGAVAFSDGNHSVQQAGLMGRALLYAKGFDGLIISFAEDESISGGNQMNEGEMSTYLGMKGKPNLSESLMVSRDLHLAEYNEAPIHFTTISTAESVDLIRAAKANGLAVTCDVAAHNLVLTDDAVSTFDSNFKVNPPLRTQADVAALLDGIKDGTIDAVVSQHTPHEVEFKKVEFHIAKDGIIAFQTVLPFLIQAGFTAEQIVDKLVVGPRKVLKREVPSLTVGEAANLVVFHPEKTWTFDDKTNKSRSANSPLLGQTLTGKVLAVINNNQFIENK